MPTKKFIHEQGVLCTAAQTESGQYLEECIHYNFHFGSQYCYTMHTLVVAEEPREGTANVSLNEDVCIIAHFLQSTIN